jgi:hypothetical protein
MTKQIDIKELIPFMKDGWVAMDEDGEWQWWQNEPERKLTHKYVYSYWWGPNGSMVCLSRVFDIAPVSDWTKSLIRINESQNNLCITDDTPHLESTVLFLDLLENKDE